MTLMVWWLQQDLFSILVRFHTHLSGIIADIEKMYREVYVAKEDADYQPKVCRSYPAKSDRNSSIPSALNLLVTSRLTPQI